MFRCPQRVLQIFPRTMLNFIQLNPPSPPLYSITEILALYIGQMNLNVKSKSRKAVEIWLTSSQSSSFLGAFVIVSCPRVVATRGTCYYIPDSAQSSTDKINHWASHPLTRPLLLMWFRGISTQGTPKDTSAGYQVIDLFSCLRTRGPKIFTYKFNKDTLCLVGWKFKPWCGLISRSAYFAQQGANMQNCLSLSLTILRLVVKIFKNMA